LLAALLLLAVFYKMGLIKRGVITKNLVLMSYVTRELYMY